MHEGESKTFQSGQLRKGTLPKDTLFIVLVIVELFKNITIHQLLLTEP